ncbi:MULTISPECIES: hypothetical protein [Mesonia]|uniref:Uncharacterized protein n=1 Tax=Mesonia oceanica TaxID=2687242 RepID=A0AC61Y738_9FLAO|nr:MULTISPECIES: hypothetical protein [Mesonia]MAN27304.1 hypothetical protein [Mesonia sp.]MAQ42301.1 hypothetical protein [Mesonia sp.]MBJ98588.1 hypothetical protein [Flavobacteriaceae bacterium]VVU99994.1 hypothetical protein FVB9532_01256 [Mesonia oceanica]|tara:strand:- start:19804 stop:20526 length:723 start_codon:yes stop_codon:yes gene_type:complete
MNWAKINVEKQLIKARNKKITEEGLLHQVKKILEQDEKKENEILKKIEENDGQSISNDFNFELLESDKIYHIEQIKNICITYRLRFLNSHYFKAELPYEAIQQIKQLQKKHQITLSGLKIIAPSKSFRLENADDPLLFAPIGNDYYYLIHKWGNDLHPLRKLYAWPFKSLENLILLIIALSIGITALLPDDLFSKNQTTAEFIMIAFFMVKWIGGMAIFYGFKKGKNFNSAIWNSKYYNA